MIADEARTWAELRDPTNPTAEAPVSRMDLRVLDRVDDSKEQIGNRSFAPVTSGEGAIVIANIRLIFCRKFSISLAAKNDASNRKSTGTFDAAPTQSRSPAYCEV
ncbi:MAG TPA: hypothetical protein VFG23_02415 [Polyangia bacterium]|nr:hypothetical protein [Polyangia bacterium]